MAKAYIQIAPVLGFKSSVFNLVFTNNEGSLKLWERNGFKKLGRIPNVARTKEGGYVDSIMWGYEFQ